MLKNNHSAKLTLLILLAIPVFAVQGAEGPWQLQQLSANEQFLLRKIPELIHEGWEIHDKLMSNIRQVQKTPGFDINTSNLTNLYKEFLAPWKEFRKLDNDFTLYQENAITYPLKLNSFYNDLFNIIGNLSNTRQAYQKALETAYLERIEALTKSGYQATRHHKYPEAAALSGAMAPRPGQKSPARSLSPDTLQRIAEYIPHTKRILVYSFAYPQSRVEIVDEENNMPIAQVITSDKTNTLAIPIKPIIINIAIYDEKDKKWDIIKSYRLTQDQVERLHSIASGFNSLIFTDIEGQEIRLPLIKK